MCGVSVIVDKTQQIDHHPILQMNEAIKSRGPDGSGTQKISIGASNIFIGNTRLAIRSDENLDQPHVSELGVLSYNGELYSIDGEENVPEEDTSYLAEWLVRVGIRSIGKLDGIFAFIFHPAKSQELWIARDTHGVKPLFLYESNDYIIVSSEIKGILASGLVETQLDHNQIGQILQTKHTKRPHTVYSAIREVEPGVCIDLLSDKQFNFHTTVSINESISLRSIWERDVERQLVSKRPIGLYLSGGVDSALILAAVRALGNSNFPTYSISNNSREIQQIERVSQEFDSKHINYPINPSWEDWTDFIGNMDQPIGDSGAFLTYLLSKHVCNHVRVVLSGAGADEYFAGYNRHVAFQYYLRGGKTLQRLAPIKQISRLTKLLGKDYARLGSKFFSGIDRTPGQTYANFISTLPTSSLNIKDLEDALEYDRMHYLVSDVLAISDINTMAHGIEMRVPFLSLRITQYARAKSADELLKHGRKWILKELLESYSGKLLNYPKRGFGIDADTLCSLEIYDQLLALDFKRILVDYVDEDYIDLLVENPKSIETPLLWNLLILAHWLELRNKS